MTDIPSTSADPQSVEREPPHNHPLVPTAAPTYRGRTLSDAHKAKLSAAQKGKVRSPELRARISATMKGRHPTDAARAKMSASAKGRPVCGGKWLTDPVWAAEQRKRCGERMKALWQDPAFRERRILSNKRRARCKTCEAGGMMPPHTASLRCESGRRNHCSCDICF